MKELKEGDKAPAIMAKDQDGNTIKLDDFKGKKVVLYFYPKDNTPGCTKEACSFRDNYAVLQKKGLAIIGVSTDDEKSHQKFINKFDLPFPLIADTDMKVVNDYGVYGEKSMYGRKYMGIFRTTFIIDEKGNIEKIIKKVDTKDSTGQVLDVLGMN